VAARHHQLLESDRRLFGTDGIRGVANTEVTPELALDVGRVAGSLLAEGPVLVGRDTRRSGEMLSAALQAGFQSIGIDTTDVGVLPAGGIGYLTAESSAEMGAIVSASHNPAQDNGIKLLSGLGTKLSDAEEDRIEALLRNPGPGWRIPTGSLIGTRFPSADGYRRYLDWLAEAMPYTLRGVSLALDCANGAAYKAAPELFERLRADVVVYAAEPDGVNINDGCGATHPEYIASRAGGRIGLSFDGDADRLIATGEDGRVVNGDGVLAIVARYWKKNKRLKGNKVVATVMSNFGFRRSMEAAGIELVETKVGDRYVLEAMEQHKAVLGGEQSGHVIFFDRSRSGDGLLTAIRLLEVVAATGQPLSELAKEALTEYPQVLRNVRVPRQSRLEEAAQLWEAVRDVEHALGPDGRVLVRMSGTEPLVRIMVEAALKDDAVGYADRLADVARQAIGEG